MQPIGTVAHGIKPVKTVRMPFEQGDKREMSGLRYVDNGKREPPKTKQCQV